MPENQPKPEAQVMLPQAVNDVIKLYLADQSGAGTQSLEERDNLWKGTAENFSVFSEKIIELGNALKDAKEKKKNFPEITKHTQLFFGYVAEEPAKKFLGDVWCSRIDPSGDLMDTGIQTAREMMGEIGIDGRLCGGPIKGVALVTVMGSVLKGKLKLTPQPKQRA